MRNGSCTNKPQDNTLLKKKKIYEKFTWNSFKHSFEKLVENQDWSADEKYIAVHVTIYNGVVGNVNILRE